MQRIDRAPSTGVIYTSFGPDTLQMLEQIIEDAWQELVRMGCPAATPGGKRVLCELMSHRVFSQASHGELDRDRLMQHAVWGFRDTLNE